MTNKPTTDSWPLISSYWQVEVPRLLNSKDDFLGDGKRSSAGAAELATLYERLLTAWDELTSQPSTERLARLRQRARSLQQNLKRSETDVMSELERQSASELQNVAKRLQRRSETLQQRRQFLAERRVSWPSELAQLRTNYANSLRTLRNESNERKAQLKTSLATEWKRFETNEAGAGPNIADLSMKQQQLQAQLLDLTERQQNLNRRKEALKLVRRQIAADLSAQQQISANTSSLRQNLKSKRQFYEELKAKLVEQGRLNADDFPTL